MNDTPGEEQIGVVIDYTLTVEGGKPSHRYSYELFLTHNTKKDTNERSLVTDISTQLDRVHKLTNFFDNKDMLTDPVYVMDQALDGSRMMVPICTPEYIKAFKEDRNSWPYQELGTFINWQNSHKRDLIIPVLVGITRKEFEMQGNGIVGLPLKLSVEIPPSYITDKAIIPMKVEEIVKIYNDYLKQWDSISS
ncbi:MAG TPA: TIR domain-containing protein [Candidatus Wunengus sp. YC60]|uniref:TIR domain-containing protein n=1 Tax=Candidatus Wunengus sp. YC60 TaxID=3367697 RepID=UPI0040289780